ncbi:MAG: lysine--tRNA ligase [FCB group bacterium]|nr:lysine--tRNA ligase [FCB group bacterium]
MDETHHSMEQDLIANRIAKLERMRARGDEPFKYNFDRSCTIAEARQAYEDADAATEDKEQIQIPVRLAGRMTSYRSHGKTSFADLRDEGARIQVYLSKKTLGDESFDFLDDVDIGDFLGVWGHVKRTRTGEITVFAEGYEMLTKSLRPLPEKYHGLTDVETRYRQRYLDLVANPEILEKFKKRITIIQSLRDILTRRGFIEVETPMLHPIAGGATARPFITHHNALDRELFMRIAPELYLKRLIVGGFEKIFEINRSFRNEGIDTTHNPEFTMLELYEAYQDYMGLMDETEEVLVEVIERVTGGTAFPYDGNELEAARPWKRIALFEAVRQYAKVDLESTRDRTEAAARAKSVGVDVDPTMGYGKIVDEVMKERVRPNLIQPTFLYDYPIEISPLAKRKRGNPALTERFQVFMGGLEVTNAFSELNDPIDQRGRFMDQLKQREQGDEEAQHLDEDFVTALEVGMPPTAGLGIGIDRLAMLLTDSPSIREVILFPQLRST